MIVEFKSNCTLHFLICINLIYYVRIRKHELKTCTVCDAGSYVCVCILCVVSVTGDLLNAVF